MRRGELRQFQAGLHLLGAREYFCVVVSNDASNMAAARALSGGVTVVPLTKAPDEVHPFWVLLAKEETHLRYDMVARAELVQSVPLSWGPKLIGALSSPNMSALDDALRTHLALG